MPHVVVIGAGIVGAATAVELLRDGHRVTILEPGEPGGEQAASYGNGTLLNPSSVIPMSAPGIWRKVPGWLADPLGPLAIRWRYLPRLLPWLSRFLRAGATEARVAETARALRPLLLDAPELHRRLAEEAGVGELITRQGVLFVFPTRADFEAEELAWRLRRENGVRWLELSADELRQREPGLDRRYTFGVLVEENGQCRDPGAYVAALVRHAHRGRGRAAARESNRLSHRGVTPAGGAHGCRRDRGRSGSDRGRSLVARTRRRRRRSRAIGNRTRLPRGHRGPRNCAAVPGHAERRQDGVRDDASGAAAGWSGGAGRARRRAKLATRRGAAGFCTTGIPRVAGGSAGGESEGLDGASAIDA